MIIEGESLADIGKQAIYEVLDEGVEVERNVGGWALQKLGSQKMRELHGVKIVLNNPLKRWCNRISLGTVVETEDYILGLNPGNVHHTNWSFYNKWRTVGMEKYPYTYGERIMVDPYSGINQYRECVRKLLNDSTTRHASIPIWRPLDQLEKFVPCNVHLHFQLNEEGKLDLLTTCRSQDVLKGLFLDCFAYSHIHEQMCLDTGLELGKYIVFEINLHMYEKDYKDEGWRNFIPSDPYEEGCVPSKATKLTDRLRRKMYIISEKLFNDEGPLDLNIKSTYWENWKLFQYLWKMNCDTWHRDSFECKDMEWVLEKNVSKTN